MKKTVIGLVLGISFLLISGQIQAETKDSSPSPEPIKVEEPKNEAINIDELIARIEEAKTWQDASGACSDAIGRCRSYEDYENIASELRKFVTRQKDYKYADVIYYMIAKVRIDELSFLTKTNDIESGRIYMSVNEKYRNEALECLDKAASVTKSKDLEIDTYALRFSIFKEIFQPQKVDAVFNEMVNKITSYSEDTVRNLSKLNEMSKKFSDNGMADYAIKLKFAYASKVGPEAARPIAEDIKKDADKYLDEGKAKDSLSTYDTYLELAQDYYDNDAMASSIMDIAEKYFNKGRYKDAIKYYSLYLVKYSASQAVADYASYKLALSYYNDKDYANAANKFDEFLRTYQNSVWFEKGFENLCRIYYETSNTDKAIENLQKLIDAYPRRDTRDYAYLLTGILYYSKPDYPKAAEVFKKIQKEFPKTAYLHPTEVLISDINDIKKGGHPSYSFGSNDIFKIWESYTSMNADISVGDGAVVVENKDAKPGEIFIKTTPGSKVIFTMKNLEDLDRFNEYWQDKEDESRLPREIKAETEKDILFFTWSAPDGGKFSEDKQSLSRAWQAPEEPGNYTITVNVGDLALVRPPDSGTRKDLPKALLIHVAVEK